MKVSRNAVIAIAAALSGTPSANAQTYAPNQNEAHGPTLLEQPETRYPVVARRRGLEGDCTVSVRIASDGRVERIEAVVCSSRLFRREARRVAQALRYQALQDQAFASHRLRLSWRIGDPAEEVRRL